MWRIQWTFQNGIIFFLLPVEWKLRGHFSPCEFFPKPNVVLGSGFSILVALTWNDRGRFFCQHHIYSFCFYSCCVFFNWFPAVCADTRVFLTVAVDLVIEGIQEPVRFLVEMRAKIFPTNERFWYFTTKPYIEQFILKLKEVSRLKYYHCVQHI